MVHIDLLCKILRFHGLALGEILEHTDTQTLIEALMEVEKTIEHYDGQSASLEFSRDPKTFYQSIQSSDHLQTGQSIDPYQKLNQAGYSLDLDPEIADLLWVYAPYRQLVESDIAFEQTLTHASEIADELIKIAENHAKLLAKHPGISEILAKAVAERIWLKFRVELLIQSGKTHLKPV